MNLWVFVDTKNCGLPLAVTDTAAELALCAGVSRALVYRYAEEYSAGKRDNSPYIKIVCPLGTEEEKYELQRK